MRNSFVFLVIAGLLIGVTVVVFADVPQLMNYQGILLDSGGEPITVPVSVILAIWDAETDGDSLWSEMRTVDPDDNGLFNVLLGESSPIGDEVFAGPDRWLGIRVEDDAEMTPRARLSSVAYSHRVATVDGTTGGVISGDVAIQSDLDVNGEIRVTGKVGIGTDSPELMLSVRDGSQTLQAIFGQGRTSGHSAIGFGEEAADNKLFLIGYDHDNNFGFMRIGGDPVSARLIVADGGNVGIGTANPVTKLEVAGSVQMHGFGMPTGASAGYVLTSSATGVGTWQPAGNIGGSGTINYIPKFTAITTLGNTGIYETDGKVNIGNGSPNETRLNVSGTSPQITIRDSGTGVNQKIGVDGNGLSLYYDSGPSLTVNRSNGNVGVGTTSPTGKLHVIGGTNHGVYGESYSTQSNVGGVTGRAKTDGGSGIYGETWSLGVSGGSSVGVYGWAPASGAAVGGAALGVLGKVNSYQDPGNSSVPCGVFGWATAGSGINAGVWGETESPSGFGVYSAGNMAVDGDFNCNGTKNAVVLTSSGRRALYCQESPEVWFEDFGEAQLKNGLTRVTLDPTFLETVTIGEQHPMKVFVTLNDDCNGVYVRRSITGFDVIELAKGKSNAHFTYRVVAKRKGFEGLRLEIMPDEFASER